MPVVDVRVMRMAVSQHLVTMQVRMRLVDATTGVPRVACQPPMKRSAGQSRPDAPQPIRIVRQREEARS